MRVIIYRTAHNEILVGTESDEGTHAEIVSTFTRTMKGETSAFIAAQNLGRRLRVPVYEYCVDGHLMLVQRAKAIDADEIPL